MLQPPPIDFAHSKEPILLEEGETTNNSAPNSANVPEVVVVPKVIDLDTYEPQFCTCMVEEMRGPQFHVVLALSAVWRQWRRNLPSVESLVPPDATEYALQEAWRQYQRPYYAHACLLRDQARFGA